MNAGPHEKVRIGGTLLRLAENRYMTFDEFYPAYLDAHADPLTRAVHAAGTLAAVTLLGVAIARRKPNLLPIALAAGYVPAWLSHFAIEGNVPKTFTHPLLSLRGDFHMAFDALTGRLPTPHSES